MFLMPKKSKYTKFYTRSMRLTKLKKENRLHASVLVVFGQNGIVCAKQLETLRLFLKRNFKKDTRFSILPRHNVAITKKPIETRMGKGKADLSY